MLDKEGEAVVADIKKAGGTATFMHLDVTDEAQWQAVVDKTVAAHGGLHVLVNNAGISGSAEADLYDTAAWNRLMGINATGVFFGMKHCIAAMSRPQRVRLSWSALTTAISGSAVFSGWQRSV